jgi:hypothetical protein
MAGAQAKPSPDGPEISYISADYARGAKVPWWLKMWAKILLAKLPMSYALWDKFGIFRHGDTAKNLDNLYISFQRYVDFYKKRLGRTPKSVLELGPGDSAGHALCAKANGMDECWLIDAGDYATTEAQHYEDFYAYLQNKGMAISPALENFSRDAVLAFTNTHYRTDGVEAMAHIPNESIDLSFSNAVFEHIARDDFGIYMQELFRVHKAGSLSRHAVDLHDHLGGALNSMRFSASFWESHWVRKAGFYTNRLTMEEMVSMAEDAGFIVHVDALQKWHNIPTPQDKMNTAFKHMSEDELNVCMFWMNLEKPQA